MENNGYLSYIETALTEYGDLDAFSDFMGGTLNYNQIGERIVGLHQLYKTIGINKGDKVALIGRNMTSWAVIYLGTISYGAVIVPILPDFNSNDIHHIVNHSEAKLLFSTDLLFDKLDETKMTKLAGIISINQCLTLVDNHSCELTKAVNNLQPLFKGDGQSFKPEQLQFPIIGSEEVMVLSYTSGTSGFSKGVLLPHRSIWSNIKYAQEHLILKPRERVVSFLPLAHAYGCLFEFLWPFTMGCHITFLTRTPSPQIITEAFRKVKPHIILSVPLILEKIFKKRVQPQLEEPKVKTLLKISGLNKIVYNKVKKKLVDVCGGQFREIIIGGAALNKDVELFLRKIEFPFTIGYGMTECGPLISYAPWTESQKFSAGQLVDRMEVKIASNDPYNEVGEILVKGDNSLLGYYKNDEATAEIFTEDGWIKTGDLGVIDEQNFIYIKGRSKNMLLGASGQNIYPEEIEATITSMEYVQECLVRDNDGKLEALIYPDYEATDAEKLSKQQIEDKLQGIKTAANKLLPAYMNIQKVTLFPEEFEKTPKKSIKRYKYIK
ncbi:AMP-binding protein [Carboxylicivirga sp. M1479]|uniref:AMP-binding protein n=1 Tax=Carboxylicivirga sp. M1479 TaxID=2594476 RepID=UPI0011784B24|nr:AMP-binding protein [Carboxylicivirga sp. M1479]TRX72692.1 long-chain fatty acid--CoA ligase [Carboxylicivirga sp. M1479]